MRASTHVVALSLVASFASVAVAGPIKPVYVAASARWVAHVDLDLLKKTEVGKAALAELDTEDANRKLAALQAVFNFDPRKDLAGITVYGQDNQPDGNVAILEGTFDADRMITLLMASDSYQSSRHGDTVIHSWIDKNNPNRSRTYGAVAPRGVVAIGQGETAVGNAIDVLAGRTPSMAKSGALSGVDFRGGAAFLHLAADMSAMTLVGTPAAAFGQQTRAVKASLSETDGVVKAKVTVEKETPELAVQLEQIARGLIALSTMQNQPTNSDAALMQNIKIATQGKTVTFALQIPSADAVDFLRSQLAKATAHSGSTLRQTLDP